MKPIFLSVVALAILFAPPGLASAAAAVNPLEIKVLSNRADLISGGDALVEVVLPSGVRPTAVRVDVDGRDVTGAFGLRANGRFIGFVEGLMTSFHSFAMRDRLKKAHGHADNHVIFQLAEVPNLPSNVGLTTFLLMDRWLAAIEADPTDDPLEVKVVRNKPADAVDTCIVQNQYITDPTVCAAAFPHYADPLIASGGPTTNDVTKCQLKPLEPADVAGPIPFTPDQLSRLATAFPGGVCDWSRPGADQVPSQPWTTFAEGPGGRPLGPPPVSTSAGSK